MQIHTTYDPTRPALRIRELTVMDQAVVSESRRWSTGARTTSVGEDGMVGVDLSRFVEHALVVGVHAIGAASTAQESVALEHLVTEVGARTVTATNEALAAANTAVSQASEAMRTAADGARKAITDASRDARQGFAEDVDRARANLLGEVNRLVGGSNPELIDRLRPLLDTFGRELNGRIAHQTGELFDAAVRQFDPADPTSPMAKHTSTLQHQHETLRSALDSNHRELAAKVAELTVAVKVAVSARDAAEQTVSITPLKGVGYATRLHPILEQIATGLGDEYTDTGALCGVLPRCKKGDGVLTVAGGQIRVVVEMTARKETTGTTTSTRRSATAPRSPHWDWSATAPTTAATPSAASAHAASCSPSTRTPTTWTCCAPSSSCCALPRSAPAPAAARMTSTPPARRSPKRSPC